MKVHRFSQRYGYIAVFLALSFVCALPLLFAHSVQRSWNNKENTSGWAWVGAVGHSVQNGNLKTRSEHLFGILNKTGEDISITVGCSYKVFKGDAHWDNDIFSNSYTVPWEEGDVYFSTTNAPGSHVRSTSRPAVNGSFNVDAYTRLDYTGEANAKAGISLNTNLHSTISSQQANKVARGALPFPSLPPNAIIKETP